ncbi:MAG: sulfotransferase [Bacteroidota bacterium]
MKSLIKRFLNFTGLNRLIGSFTHYAIQQAIKLYPDTIEELSIAQNESKNNQLLDRLNLKHKGICLNGKVFISHPLMVRMGKNIHIGNNAYFFTKGGLTIGDNTHFSRNVSIYTANHNYEGNALPYDDNYIEKPVFIGKNVWIGMNVSIVPGVSIGEGAIIGMGAVISKDVTKGEIVGISPQKILKTRDSELYQKLSKDGKFGGVNGRLIDSKDYNRLGKNASELGENLIFAVGTGRCGSTTLAKVLNQHPDIDFRHEPNGQLIKLSTDYAHGEVSREEVKRRLSLMYDQALTTERIYGEADHKLFNLIEILRELYPKAKFIWQIRNAFDTVNSTFSRGMFHDKEFNFQEREELNVNTIYSFDLYSKNRLNGFKLGEFILEKWQNMSPIERNSWYWNYVNSKIEIQFSELYESQKFMLRIESISSQISDIYKFVKISPITNPSFPSANKANYNLASSEDQKKTINESVNKWCKKGMDKWYS